MFHIDIQLRIQSVQPGSTIAKLVMQRCGDSYTVLGPFRQVNDGTKGRYP